MAVLRSKSVPTLTRLPTDPTCPPSSRPGTHDARPKIPRLRSAMVVSSTSHFVSAYAPHAEREDPFSLAGFFPRPISTAAHEAAPRTHEWDWLRTSDDDDDDDDDVPIEYLSGRVSPMSSDDDWSAHTPTPHDLEDALSRMGDFDFEEDALTRETIKREDKLGVLELNSDTFFASRGPELYVDDRLLSPYTQPGDPLDVDAVYDALRALRTAHSLPKGSAAAHPSPTLDGLFSPKTDADDKVEVAGQGQWGALMSWGVSRVIDYLSPV